MNQEPLFVIVIPTYTRSELLIRALESVKNQGYQNWICVIVNDGSTDDTESRVKEFIRQDTRYLYIRQENKGVNAARNTGIEYVQDKKIDGYYIFIDDDDYLCDGALSKASVVIAKNPIYCWFGFDCINIKTNKKISLIKSYGVNNYINDYMFSNNLRGDITWFTHSSILGEFRFCKEIKNGEEWYFWSQLAIENDVYIVDEPGSYKDYLPEGLTKSGFNRDKAIQVMRLKLEILSPIVGEKKMIHQIITLSKNYYQKGQKKKARDLLIKTFKLNPFYLRQYPHWIKQLLY